MSNPMQNTVDNAVGLVASAQDAAGPVTTSLEQIVDKTKAIADSLYDAAGVSISTR